MGATMATVFPMNRKWKHSTFNAHIQRRAVLASAVRAKFMAAQLKNEIVTFHEPEPERGSTGVNIYSIFLSPAADQHLQ
jgi:hypothetical protein